MNKLRNLIESVGLSFKNQILLFALINIVLLGGTAAIFLLYKANPIIIAIGLFITSLIDYLFLSRYKGVRKSKERDILVEFISILSFFKTYINNGYSVYQSLNELTNYVGGELLERVETLISNMDNDKTITPFIEFSGLFSSLQVEQLMISIYQMIDEGNSSAYFNQFEMLFSNMRHDMLKNEIDSKEKALSNMTVFPLIGSALLIVMITFGILAVIGETINGI